MDLIERSVLVASAVVGLSVAGWMVLHGYKAPTCPPTISLVPVVIPVATTAAPAPMHDELRPVVLSPEYTDDSVVADPDGKCNAQTPELVAMVRGWIAGRGGVSIDPQSGIAFTHTKYDEGRDGPWPRFHDANAKRVCGEEALWLRAFMVDTLKDHPGLTCCDGTCTYGGEEYAPDGTIKFEKRHDADLDDDVWVLVSWDEQYTEGMREEWAAHVRSDFAKVAKNMAASCHEPAGVRFE
ncbi:MAG TPA: hypothetical protein VGM90_09550 [Kofleriaceae bacterium]|jgi:hypothetical protein